MKIIKSSIIGILLFLLLNVFITILSYFDIIKNICILKIISFIIVFIISSFYLGFTTKKNGLINGLKMSMIYVLLSLLLIIILPNLELNIKLLLYYFLIALLCSIGSILGVNIKKTIR